MNAITHIDDSILNHPKFEKQLELENLMRTSGIENFRKRNEKAVQKHNASETRAVNRLVIAAHDKMVEAINNFVEAAKKGAGRRHAALKYVQRLDADVVANITARTILDHIGAPVSLAKMAMGLGNAIENEVNARIFEEEMPKAFKKYHQKALKETMARRQWSHLLFPAKFLGVELEDWEIRDKGLLGKTLVELFEQSTGLVSIVQVNGSKGTMYMVQPNKDTLSWIEEENRRTEHLYPMLMPCVIPPKPWTTPFDGGYYTPVICRPTLVKTRNRSYLEELAERDMPEVYAAVNALQNTAWAINTKVLEVVETLWSSNSSLGDIPLAEDIPLPARPDWLPPSDQRMNKEDMTPEQRMEFDQWRAKTHEVKVLNAGLISKRTNFKRTLYVANLFRDEEEIFFPHQLDWRGRAYPLPMFLNPQGNDMQRGLLQFANGVPLTDEDGANWLAIHGAGMFGYDKVSLEERVAWVYQHEDRILASAENPYDNRFWLDADKPWQFLAFCFDWAGFKAEGYDYVSHLPVQMDGTCNGLQNFSAMLLDEIGGRAVNLVPADKPNDIYQQVADLVIERVGEDTLSEDEEVAMIARGWYGNITRKVTKRPVMTLAYGAKRFGFVSQIEEDTLKPWREKSPETYPFISYNEEGKAFDYGYKAAMYMAGLIWDCVGRVVVAARNAMDWLQEASKVASNEGLPINWVTPAGLLVQQAYRVPNIKVVNTTFNQQRLQLHLQVGVGKIDSRRQAAGISPNWVHSLDASHLMKTINGCYERGIRSFSMIHDSYGTHAGNAAILAYELRHQFVQMYSKSDVLARFKQMLEEQTGMELPPLPPKGTLDLQQVYDSPFFFA